MKELADLLAGQAFLDGLPEETVAFIAGCAKNVRFDAGQYIYRSGESADDFYLIRHGTAALELFDPARGPITFQTVKTGEILGVSWLVPPHRRHYDARAVELIRAIAFDAKCLRAKCEADHSLGYEMMKRFMPPLMERLEAARLQSADLYGRS
jgi:CRP/FNR family cyclic AMP-dependent transcriptional regulator